MRNSRIWEEVRQKEKCALAEDHCVEGTVALHHQQQIWLVQNSYNKTKLQLLCSLKSWCGNDAVAHMNYCFGFRGPVVTQLLSCWTVTSSEISGNCSPVIWLCVWGLDEKLGLVNIENCALWLLPEDILQLVHAFIYYCMCMSDHLSDRGTQLTSTLSFIAGELWLQCIAVHWAIYCYFKIMWYNNCSGTLLQYSNNKEILPNPSENDAMSTETKGQGDIYTM